MLSDIDRILISQQQIARRIDELARQITADHMPPKIPRSRRDHHRPQPHRRNHLLRRPHPPHAHLHEDDGYYRNVPDIVTLKPEVIGRLA